MLHKELSKTAKRFSKKLTSFAAKFALFPLIKIYFKIIPTVFSFWGGAIGGGREKVRNLLIKSKPNLNLQYK